MTTTLLEGLKKAESYCVASEHCASEVRMKLTTWGIPETDHDTILESLIFNKFIDEKRYSEAFARDKFRFNKWGKVKIVQMLLQKKISREAVEYAIETIDSENYIETLTELLQAKKRSLKGDEKYKLKGKLYRYALGKGFGSDDIGKVLELLFRE